MKFIVSPQAAIEAGKRLSNILSETEGHKLLMLSGGSAFRLLEEIKDAGLNKKITITVLDDRRSFDNGVNNFSQLMQTKFYMRAKFLKCNFFDTRSDSRRNLEEEAEIFEKDLREWRKKYPQGTIITTMGIGEDGHTAGIMPFPESKENFKNLFENWKRWMIGYNAGDKNQFPERITVTNGFLRNQVDIAIVYTSGAQKQFVLGKALETKEDIHEVPARIIHDMKNIFLYTDTDKM